MNLGIGIISKEVRDKTADFLLTKPVSRVTILVAKMMAAFTCIVLHERDFFAANVSNCVFYFDGTI